MFQVFSNLKNTVKIHATAGARYEIKNMKGVKRAAMRRGTRVPSGGEVIREIG